MKEVERPAPILMAALNHDFDGVGNAAVGFDSCIPQIIESAQDVVVPKRREREAEPAFVDDFAGSKRAEHAALEQVVFGPLAGLSADLRPARSYSSSPSRTQMVVWNEERRLGGRFGDRKGHASQFQPPSSSCSPRSCLASASFGFLKYEPMPRILPLMQGSVSP